jgi:L-serine/L-threonine ammonia-lyase
MIGRRQASSFWRLGLFIKLLLWQLSVPPTATSFPVAVVVPRPTTTKTIMELPAVPSDHGNWAAAVSAEARTLFYETPLLYSAPLSKRASSSRNGADVEVDVYIKLDCLQPSGSFKDRGMAHLLTTLRRQHGCRSIVSSSGGNAGLAAATVARQLLGSRHGHDNDDDDNIMHCTVVVPATTKPHVINKLRDDLAATVIVHGNVWNEADAYARQLVARDESGRTAYVPPYENESLWTGHSTVVDEIYRQLGGNDKQNSITPDAIIVSVGGGGLLCGVLEGLQRRQRLGEDDGEEDDRACHVIAAETVGASSFAQAYRRGELVTLPKIDSVATSLGALQVSPSALSRAKEYGTDVSPAVCTDAQAIDACWQVRRARVHERTLTKKLSIHFLFVLFLSVCPGPSYIGRTSLWSGIGRDLFATFRLFVVAEEEQ